MCGRTRLSTALSSAAAPSSAFTKPWFEQCQLSIQRWSRCWCEEKKRDRGCATRLAETLDVFDLGPRRTYRSGRVEVESRPICDRQSIDGGKNDAPPLGCWSLCSVARHSL